MEAFLENITENEVLKIVLALIVFMVYLALRNLAKRRVIRVALKSAFSDQRTAYVQKVFGIALAILFLFAMAWIFDISLSGLEIYFVSFFTVAGIALFAQWSVISNITSSVILFFYFPYKIGSHVRIVDGDNSIQGIVQDITLFSIIFLDDEGKLVHYPSSLAIQKPMIEIK